MLDGTYEPALLLRVEETRPAAGNTDVDGRAFREPARLGEG